MSLDTHRLRSFLHVVELGSLSAAARRAHLSQPALSRHVQQLEEDMGVALFERTGRGMRVTDAGALLAERARPLLTQLEQLASEVAAQAEVVTGSVSLAVPPSVGMALPADVIEVFREAHPKVALRVVVALSGAIHDALVRGSLDLGILYQPVRSPAVRTEALWRESLWCVGGPGEFEKGSALRLRGVLAEPLILPAPRHGLRAFVEGHAARLGAGVDVPVEADSLQLLLELVRRGAGRTLLPARAFADELAAGRLSAARVTHPALERKTLLAWSAERHMSRAGRALAEVVRGRARRRRKG